MPTGIFSGAKCHLNERLECSGGWKMWGFFEMLVWCLQGYYGIQRTLTLHLSTDSYKASWSVSLCVLYWASRVVLVVKNPLASAGHVRDTGSVPESGRSPGGGHGSPLQYSGLENPMDRAAWWATVHRVTKSWTQLKWLSMHITFSNKN